MFSSDMILALRSRWRQILAVFFVTLALATVWLLLVDRVYIARSSLLFDQRAPNPELQDNGPTIDERALLGTQADLVKSEAVARRVIRATRLGDDAALRKEWQAQGSRGTYESWLVAYLLGHIDVTPERDTNVLSVRVHWDDPQIAARLANAFASEFVAMRLEISTNTAKQYAKWFQVQTREVRQNLEQAQKAVTDFQRSQGMVDGNALALEVDRLSALSGQLAQAEGAAADMRSRAGSRAAESPDVQGSAVVASLRRQLAESEAKISQLAATHGDAHPDMIAARAERDTLRAKLGAETADATQTVRVASSAASTRESELRKLVEAQRGRMLAVTANQAQLEALQNDVATKQKAYDAVSQRLNMMRLQSGLPTINAQQVDHATPPLLPSSPNVPLLLMLAAIGGAGLGIILAIALEMRRPLVRTANGLFETTGVPVLGNFNFGAFPSVRTLKLGGI